jgi:uncharacterized protein YbjT (DUF2867 family)
MFFVSGITGHVGGATARHLLGAGHAVRALVRDPQKAAAWAEQGVELRQGEFSDAAAVAGALEGVEGAYLMLPPTFVPGPDFAGARAIIASYQEALGQAPPPRVVALSSIGSEKSSGLGLITATHLLEEGLGDLPFPTAFIRAGSFLENYSYLLDAAAATGRFDTFLLPTNRQVGVIATDDIGKEVARRLVDDSWSGKLIVELGSPYSADDVAKAVGDALGKSVQAHTIPREQWAGVLETFGMPAGGTGVYEEMAEGVNAGWIAFGAPGAEPVAATITPAQFFAQLQQAKKQ